MNRTHRVVWSAARQTWVAAHELATGRTKSSQSRSAVLAGVLLAGLTGSALAASYTASDEATLRQAIINANADGDAASSITLTSNIAVGSAAFATITKPVTIDSGTFTLSGVQGTGTTGQGSSLSFAGGNLTLTGKFAGGSAASANSTAAGVTGVIMTGGSLSLAGSVTGGAGGNTTQSGSAGRNSGAGGIGMAATAVQLINQVGSTITGGAGGTYNQQNVALSANSNLGAGAAGLTMTSGANGYLDNRGTIRGGAGGGAINLNSKAFITNGGVGGVGATITGGTHLNSGTIAGGVGGAGLSNTSFSASGAGGIGLRLDQGTMTNSGTLAGANGRAGGSGINPAGTGSAGGVGVVLTGKSTLDNSGAIRGGNGGGTISGVAQSGNGVGVTGNGGVTVVNSGTIAAGTGDFRPANAITFTGGNNLLELYAGSKITGNVVANAATDRLRLLGTADATLDVTDGSYQGFGLYEKAEAATWTLTGAATTLTPWTITGGVLATAQDSSLGTIAGALTINGGTLQATGTTFTTTDRNVILGAAGGTIDIADAANTLAVTQPVTGAGGLNKVGAGTLAITGASTWSGGTTVSAGTLSIGNGGTTGSIVGDVTDNGVLAFNRTDAVTFGGVVSGTGSVVQRGTGSTTLTGANTYTGGTSISAGTLSIGNGGTTGSIVGNIANAGTLVFNRSDALDLAGAISGNGTINQVGIGNTNLTGNSGGFGGTTNVTNGTFRVNGTLGSASSKLTVSNGATLGGAGTIGGNVSIGNGILAPGNSPATLTIAGDLTLGAASVLNYELGQANVVGGALNDRTVVGGNLTLDGTLNVTQSAGGTYGAGIYRLIDYAGTLTDNGLALGSMPATSVNYLQTSVAKQVNLVNSNGLILNYWDGDAGGRNDGNIAGGNGTWTAVASGATADRWTQADGLINAPYQNPSFAIFTGAPGVVTVDNKDGQVSVTGMQFAASGYRIQGGDIALAAGTNAIRVGDGTATGAGTTATIASALTGAGQLDKVDLGTLVLAGTNTYTGGTTISGGTLQLGEGGTTGSIVDGNIANNGVLAINRSNAVAIAGNITGNGALTQIGAGTTTLTGANTYAGGTTVTAGTLQLGDGGTIGSIAGNVATTAPGTLAFNRSDAVTFGGVISGTGAVTQVGAGTTTLTGNNSYTGGTTIAAGTLSLGNGGTTGSIVGDVTNNGTLLFNRADALDFAGAISGKGTNAQIGAGNTNLTGNSNAFSGVTNVTGGTLRVNGTLGNAGSTVNVSNGATLGGAGTIGGSVAVGSSTLSPGNAGAGVLTINGNLALGAASQLNYDFGQANAANSALNDLTVVGGNLTLGGTLNVTPSVAGGYDPGIYRLINYTGALTDNGVAFGSMPPDTDNYVQTSVANQVNLVNSRGLTLNWWDGDAGATNDGKVAGGSGTWIAGPTGSDRWTEASGLINAPYQNPSFAVFTAAPGTVTVDNSAGQIAVSGMQFATGGYRLQGGAIELAAGNDIVRVGDGTSASPGMTATIASNLIGAGRLEKTDAGTLVLTGTNTYTGGTAISGGTLQLGDGGTTGSIVDGAIANNGVLAINRSDAVAVTGNITGMGALTQMGAGTTTLTGANSYSGGTLISGGTLRGAAGSLGTGAITDNAALIVDQATDATFAAAINGTGTLVKTGAGNLNLTGASALSGTTSVAQGQLSVNGSLANSAVTVASGATLAGSGTVGATTVRGTVSPGNAGIGTLGVNGNYVQAAGSTYQVQVDSATRGTSDRINVAGNATIEAGSTLAVTRTAINPYALNSRYTVLNATGGVNGTYGLTGDTSTAFVRVVDTYDANNVYLTAEQNRSFQSASITGNQFGVAGALQSLGIDSPLRGALAWLPSDAAARNAFDQLSGEAHASVQTALLDDSRFVRDAANDRLLGAFCAPGASDQIRTQTSTAGAAGADCASGTGVTSWGRVFGSTARIDSDGNAARLKRDIGGFFVGADTTLAGG